MTQIFQNIRRIGNPLVHNAGQFILSLAMITAFQMIFGAENTLAGVALSVSATMFPVMDLKIRPRTAACIMTGLFVGCGVVAQAALISPWIAFVLNFAFVLVLMLLSCEPIAMKPSVSFLLCFVFCQSAPVPADRFPVRMAGLAAGGLIIAAVTLIAWHRKGYGKGGRTLKEQIRLSAANRSYILRMAAGISSAMLAASLLQLQKPLWISIVVMSLTQIELRETVERIRHRSVATVLGVVVFVIVFRILVPPQYAFAFILLMGYLSYFTPEYKHKQIVNAISAINASLVLLDTSTAIANRFLCLAGGIVIVLGLFHAEKWASKNLRPAMLLSRADGDLKAA